MDNYFEIAFKKDKSNINAAQTVYGVKLTQIKDHYNLEMSISHDGISGRRFLNSSVNYPMGKEELQKLITGLASLVDANAPNDA
jgi:hypothetical protein